MTTLSVALKEGLKVYGHSSFMCNIMADLYPRHQARMLETAISEELNDSFTLDGLLRENCEEYRERLLLVEGKWQDDQLYEWRVDWWKALISRLESEGFRNPL